MTTPENNVCCVPKNTLSNGKVYTSIVIDWALQNKLRLGVPVLPQSWGNTSMHIFDFFADFWLQLGAFELYH